jgi:hypothetical protein
MSASTRRLPTLNLKLGKDSFPVKKVDLFENLGLFQGKDSPLSAEEYEVQSPVGASVFKGFVSIIEGGRITVSEENCEAFRLLSDEFGFEELSIACKEFLGSRGQAIDSSSIESIGCDRYPIRQVTLTVGERSRTYGVLTSMKEVWHFVFDLRKVDENGISIDGVVVNDRQVEKAAETIYWNAVAHLPDDVHKRPFLVCLLWTIQSELYFGGLDASIYCLDRLHEIAPTNFEKARLLLLSQCDPASPDGLVPLRDADWEIIDEAIELLKNEKNGKANDAKELLGRLKAIGQYGIPWWKRNKTRENSVEYREATPDSLSSATLKNRLDSSTTDDDPQVSAPPKPRPRPPSGCDSG